jgi:CRP/FNR family transcriptional regulator, anaerobic regulatory protein
MGVLEAIPTREFASALIGGGKRLVLTEAELSKFGNLARRISFPAKTTIFTETEPAIAIYMLTRGIARLYKTLADGRRQIVGFALPGDFLGSPFSDRHTFSVDAISEVAACELSRGRFLNFLQSKPYTLYVMLEAALRETNVARDHILLLGCGSAEERFAEFIIGWRARVGRGGVLSNLVPLPMSRKDVADFLGLTIETVSRVLTRLEREKVVRILPKALLLMGSTERPLLFDRSHNVA